jgi:hypothetical protein
MYGLSGRAGGIPPALGSAQTERHSDKKLNKPAQSTCYACLCALDYSDKKPQIAYTATRLFNVTLNRTISMIMVQGKHVVIRNGRCYAVRKQLSLTDRIASSHQQYSNYSASTTVPDIKLRGSRKISNRNF